MVLEEMSGRKHLMYAQNCLNLMEDTYRRLIEVEKAPDSASSRYLIQEKRFHETMLPYLRLRLNFYLLYMAHLSDPKPSVPDPEAYQVHPSRFEQVLTGLTGALKQIGKRKQRSDTGDQKPGLRFDQ